MVAYDSCMKDEPLSRYSAARTLSRYAAARTHTVERLYKPNVYAQPHTLIAFLADKEKQNTYKIRHVDAVLLSGQK